MFKKFFYSLIFLISFASVPAAHAYAGPGVAIGAVIVVITVCITFFASLFLTLFSSLKKLFILMIKSFKNINLKNKRLNKK